MSLDVLSWDLSGRLLLEAPSTLPRLPRIVATVGWSGPRVVLADRQRPLLLRLGPGQIPKVLDLSRLAKLRGDRSQVAAIDH
jgi:hypothetical protein